MKAAIDHYYGYLKDTMREVALGSEVYYPTMNEFDMAEDALYALLCSGEGGYMCNTYEKLEYRYELVELLQNILTGIRDKVLYSASGRFNAILDNRFVKQEMDKRLYYLGRWKHMNTNLQTYRFPTPHSSYKCDHIQKLISDILRIREHRIWGSG